MSYYTDQEGQIQQIVSGHPPLPPSSSPAVLLTAQQQQQLLHPQLAQYEAQQDPHQQMLQVAYTPAAAAGMAQWGYAPTGHQQVAFQQLPPSPQAYPVAAALAGAAAGSAGGADGATLLHPQLAQQGGYQVLATGSGVDPGFPAVSQGLVLDQYALMNPAFAGGGISGGGGYAAVPAPPPPRMPRGGAFNPAGAGHPMLRGDAAYADPRAFLMGGPGGGSRGGGGIGAQMHGIMQGAIGGGVAVGGPFYTVTVDELLAVLSALPRGRSAVQAVGHMLPGLDSRALAALLKELHKRTMAAAAVEIFDWLRGLPPGHELNALLDVYTYTTMIAQCTGPSQLQRALTLARDMRSRGVDPNTHTFSAIIKVCIKAGEPEMALETYSQMIAEGCTPNLVTYNTLLEVFSKQAMWEEAVSILKSLKGQGLRAETRTFNVVMAACNAAGQHAQALAVYASMVAAGRAPSTASYNAAISAHCRMGAVDAAWAMLQEMAARGCERTPATFMAILSAAEGAARWRLALDALDSMAASGVRITPQAYVAAVGACAAAGQLGVARELTAKFLGPARGGGAQPTMAAPAHLLVALHDRCCDWAAAHAVYDSFAATGVRPDAQTFGAVVRALWSCGSVAGCLLALRVFEQACQQGVFKLSVSVDEGDTRVVFTLPAVGPEMALVALWRLLRELRGRLETDGPGILRHRVLLLVGRGDPSDAPSPTTAAAMRAVCAIPGCPFALLESSDPAGASAGTSPAAARLAARADALAHWLSSPAGAAVGPAALLLPPEALAPLSPSDLLSHQEAAIAAAASLYSQLSASAAAAAAAATASGGVVSPAAVPGSGSGDRLDAFAAALRPALLAMTGSGSVSVPGGGGYSSSASASASAAATAAAAAATDAVSSSSTSGLGLFDGAASGGIPSPSRRTTPSASAASLATSTEGATTALRGGTIVAPALAPTPLGLALAAQLPSPPTPFSGGSGGAASPSRGGSVSPTASSAAAAAAAPGAAVAALSVLCGVLLTGAGALPPGAAPPDAAVAGAGAREVAAHAAAHPLARGLAPRRVAELSLAAARRAAGLWPAWPHVLIPVTGCSDPEADVARPELCAYISALAAAAAAGAASP